LQAIIMTTRAQGIKRFTGDKAFVKLRACVFDIDFSCSSAITSFAPRPKASVLTLDST
jgi:hypothetical protein